MWSGTPILWWLQHYTANHQVRVKIELSYFICVMFHFGFAPWPYDTNVSSLNAKLGTRSFYLKQVMESGPREATRCHTGCSYPQSISPADVTGVAN